jgi:hypothetical protein
MFSSAAITVFNAFMSKDQLINTGQNPHESNGMADVMGQQEAIAFVKRYGARPQVDNYPMIRSSLFEMFMAYQQFMLAWSNQFRTPFTFTFMPEIFPGGKVAFAEHGFQMYVESVTHTWDYETGFQTTAQMKAPAAYGTPNPDLPPNMAQAMVEPIRMAANTPSGSKKVAGS